MSKVLVLLSLVFSCGWAQAYGINLTGGHSEISASNEITLRNVKFGSINSAWVKLVWNPQLNSFTPTDFGDDSGQTQSMSMLSGSWTMRFDWACRGNAASASWTLFENGSCVDSQNHPCTWSYRNSEFLLNYGQAVGALYRGAYDGNKLSGTMSYQSEKGCWSAARNQPVPPALQRTPRPNSPVRP